MGHEWGKAIASFTRPFFFHSRHTLLNLIQEEKIDLSFVFSHRLNLNDAADGYSTCKKDKDTYTGMVMKPELN